MPIPQPPIPLDHSCSVIWNNTLYTYTSKALQSLPLGRGAEWATLAPGVSVQGGVCVKSTPANNTDAAGLWIVGGVAATTSGYKGLQKFTFSTGQWATIEPNVPVTENRLWHSAVYLNHSDSILVYAGTQDGKKQPTSQTFTINATEPYDVLAYQALADPAIQPELIPYSQSKALMVGGSETNTKMMLFSHSDGWTDLNATLANPFYNHTNIRAIVINGDDSSKSLYTFDMTVSPNQVNRTIFEDADGHPVKGAVPEVEGRGKAGRATEKRADLTAQEWPAYNNTLVPWTTRTTYSIARDQSGLTVMSGGNPDDVLCMFRARKNAWVNATQMLVENTDNHSFLATSVPKDGSTPSPSPSPSETAPAAVSSSSSSSSTTAAAATHSSDPPVPMKILGAVLGSIFGLALIVLAILFLLNRRRKRRQHNEIGHQRRSSGLPTDEKDTMDFMDRGLPQASSGRAGAIHQVNPSGNSVSSVALLLGRSGQNRNSKKGNLGSDTTSQGKKHIQFSKTSKPMPQDVVPKAREAPSEETESDPRLSRRLSLRGMPSRVRGSARRSSGWNRYWSEGSSMNILGLGGSRRTTMEEGAGDSAGSLYSEPRRSIVTQFTQHSALPQPLKVPVPGQPELNRVNSGSPTLALHSSTHPLTKEMSGTIERPASGSSFSSYTDDGMDQFSSGIPASIHEQQHTWTPMDGRNNYAPSLAYTESVYASTVARDTRQYPQDFRFPQPPQRPLPPQSSDMSWVNLGNPQAQGNQ